MTLSREQLRKIATTSNPSRLINWNEKAMNKWKDVTQGVAGTHDNGHAATRAVNAFQHGVQQEQTDPNVIRAAIHPSNEERMLRHHGVKGQHWGTRKAAKAHAKWEKGIKKSAQAKYMQAHNASGPKMNALIHNFNEKWEKKNGQNYGPKYEAAFQKEYGPAYKKTVEGILNSHPNNISPSGEHKAHYTVNGFMDYSVDVKPHKVKHDGLTESDTLQHHGVKGQHWGTHKSKGTATAKSTKIADKVLNKAIKAKGKENFKKVAKDKKYLKGSDWVTIAAATSLGTPITGALVGTGLRARRTKSDRDKALAKARKQLTNN